MPEVPNNIDMTLGNRGLTDQEENQIVTFLQTLTDGFTTPYPDINTYTGQCMTGGTAATQGNEFLIPAPQPLPPCASAICAVRPPPRRTLSLRTRRSIRRRSCQSRRPTRSADSRLRPAALRRCDHGGRINHCPCRKVGGVTRYASSNPSHTSGSWACPHKAAIYRHGRHSRRRYRTRSRREEGLMR
jgi:hypothetical protein